MRLDNSTMPFGPRQARKPDAVSAAVAAILMSCTATAQEPATAQEEETLQEVVVLGSFFRPTVASSATKFDLTVQDTPQAISVLTSDILTKFNVQNLTDVDKFTAGVHSTSTSANTTWFSGDIVARGFALDQLSGYKINGFSAIRQFQPDPVLAERLEFVKGPSSVTYGVNNYGGTINTVLKSPQADAAYIATGEVTSHGGYKISADATGPLNDDGTVRYRFVGAWDDQKSNKDKFFFERMPLYGRVQWDVSPATTIDAYVLYQKEVARDDFGPAAYLDANGSIIEPFAVDRDQLLTLDDSRIRRESQQVYASAAHRFDNDTNITFKAGYLKNEHSYNMLYLYNYGFFQGPYQDVYYKFDSREITSKDAELSFGGDFELFGREHKFILLAESRTIRFDFTDFPFGSLVSGDPGQPVAERAVNQFAPDWSTLLPLDFDYLRTSNGYYRQAEDRIAVAGQSLFALTDRLSMLVGLRWDQISQDTRDVRFDPDPDDGTIIPEYDIRTDQTLTNVTPRFGLVYAITPRINGYVSYSEGFIPQEGTKRSGDAVEPEVGVQIEAGVKGEFFDAKLGTSFTAFYIEREDVAVSDPANTLDESFVVTGRRQKHQGIEVEVMGRLLTDLNVIATYAYLDTEVTEDVVSDPLDSALGNPMGGVPKTSGSLFLEYQLGGALRDVTISGGAAYVGKRPSQERTLEGRFGYGGGFPIFSLSDYTTVDLGIAYRRSPRTTISLHGNNILDEDYFNTAEIPAECCAVNFMQRGMGREVALRVSHEF
jgi:TonB-dependent siderophore receptor